MAAWRKKKLYGDKRPVSMTTEIYKPGSIKIKFSVVLERAVVRVKTKDDVDEGDGGKFG